MITKMKKNKKQFMQYFKEKIKTLRNEYKGDDRAAIIKAKGKCEICGREEGDPAVFGPSHYIQKRIKFNVSLCIHKIVSQGYVNEGYTHKVVLCDFCHLSYHLFTRLDPDALFGNKTVGEVANYKRKESVISKSLRNRLN